MQLNPNHTVFLQELHSLWSKISKKLFKLVEFPIFSERFNVAIFAIFTTNPKKPRSFQGAWIEADVTSTKERYSWFLDKNFRIFIHFKRNILVENHFLMAIYRTNVWSGLVIVLQTSKKDFVMYNSVL